MPLPKLLLSLVGEAILASAEVDGALALDADHIAQQVWPAWDRQTDLAGKCAELEALARAPQAQIDVLLESLGGIVSIKESVRLALRILPALIRRHWRRPAHPSGTTCPRVVDLTTATALVPFIAPNLAWFEPGDKPAALDGWELNDLLDLSSNGEFWFASRRNEQDTLVFLTHPAARDYVRGPGRAMLEQLLRTEPIAGVVPLLQVYPDADPPCIRYAPSNGASLASLVREWRETDAKCEPLEVAELVLKIAEMLGRLHERRPPIVDGNLTPTRIIVSDKANTQTPSSVSPGVKGVNGSAEWDCRLAYLGLGIPTDSPLPLVSRDLRKPLAPPDDVRALGLIWFQLMTRDLTRGVPHGGAWRRRLAENGMSPGLVDIMEACFEDESADRPADGGVLAGRMRDELAKTAPAVLMPAAPIVSPAVKPAASRGRRDVWQLLDAIDKKAPEKSKLVTNSVGMKLVLIPSGGFRMGSPISESGRRDNEDPHHEVTLSKDYYLGIFPVTQSQYVTVMKQNPAHFAPKNGGSADLPVETVSFDDAVLFCQRLSALPEEKNTVRRYRLPTEAEWEFACRAGTTTAFSFGPSLGHGQANFEANFPYGEAARGVPLQMTSPQETYPANNFGLYDMHGNVWEWCQDWLDSLYYRQSPKRDPSGPTKGQFRVVRGGSWRNHATTCRSAFRNGLAPNSRDSYTGFRVVLEL